MQATGKAYRSLVKTMETVLATGKKPFSAKELKANTKVFTKAEKHVKAAQGIVEKVNVAVADADKLVKAIKNKAG